MTPRRQRQFGQRFGQRRGYAMVLVLVFLAVMMAFVAVGQRHVNSMLRIEQANFDAEMRGDRRRALGQALQVLQTGPPPTDPFICSTTLDTSYGPQSFKITYRYKGGSDWIVRAELGSHPTLLPDSF